MWVRSPRSRSLMLRSLIPAASASSVCVRPAVRRSARTRAPNRKSSLVILRCVADRIAVPRQASDSVTTRWVLVMALGRSPLHHRTTYTTRHGGTPMAEHENKALVRRYYDEVFNERRVD